MIYEKMFDKKLTIEAAENLYSEFINLCMTAGTSKSERLLGSEKLFNKVCSEFKPSIDLAKQLPTVTIEFPSDDAKQYDALLYLEEIESPIEIECTTAMDQQDFALRREHMDQYGRAPAHGKILHTGKTKNTRKIINTPSSTISDHEAYIQSIEDFHKRVPESFQKKVEKQRSAKIYQNTLLIIHVDDKQFCISPNDFIAPLKEIARSLQGYSHGFKAVYIVGTSGNAIAVKTLELMPLSLNR